MENIITLLQDQDFNRPTVEIALDLIAAATGYRAEKRYIEFGSPRVLIPRPDQPKYNTFVPVKVDPGYDARLNGENGFLYRRLPIAAIDASSNLTVSPPEYPFTMRQVIDQINDQLGLQLEPDEIEDTYVNLPGTFELVIDKYNLAWYGKRNVVAVETGQLLQLFPVRNLQGFKGPLDPGFIPSTRPYGGTSLSRLVTLMNTSNFVNYQTPQDFTLAAPGPSNRNGFNTNIHYTSHVPGKMSGSCFYNRLSLQVLNYLDVSPVSIPELPFRVHDILPAINSALGLDLTPAEVENTLYTQLQQSYEIKISGQYTSLAWLESSFNFSARFDNWRVTPEGIPRITPEGIQRMTLAI